MEEKKRPLTEAEQYAILAYSIGTWKELKFNAYHAKMAKMIEDGRTASSVTPEQSLAYEKELYKVLTGDLLTEFFDDRDKLEWLREVIAQQELPEGSDYTAFYASFDELLKKEIDSVFGAPGDKE